MTKIVFKIKGMSCMGCVNAVRNAIESVAGIISHDVSLEEGRAVVEFDESKTTPQDIEKALKETPYEVTLLEE